MKQTVLKVLFLEDDPHDAELNLRTLLKENWIIDSRLASDESSFNACLNEFDPDIILSDYNLPVFNGMDALQISKGKKPFTPFIIVSGSLNEEMAADCIKQGAWDYVKKEYLVRLNPAVKNAMELRIERQRRKLAETALKESEEHFRALAQNSRDVIMRFDKNCRHLFVNQAIYNQLQIKPESFINKTHHEMGVFDPNLCHIWETTILKVFETQKPQEIEFSIPAKDETVYLEWSLFPEFNTQAEVLTVVAIARDISFKKAAKDALSRSEERLQLALEGTSDGLWDWDLKTNEIYFSPRYFTMLGYQQDELKHDINVFADLMHPDDQVRTLDHINHVIDKHAETIEVEVRLRRSDGSYAWILSRGKVYSIDGSGDPVRIVGTNVDISFRKRQEEIRQTIFDIGNEVITTRNIEELFEKIQKLLGRIIDTRNCYIALYDENTNRITLPFHRDEKDRFVEFPAGKTLTSYVIRTGEAQLVDKARIKELSDAGEIESVGAPSVSWLGVPLKINKKVLGVFTVQSYDESIQYNQEDVKILEFVSDQIAIAIERKKDEENLIMAKERAEESDRLKSSFLSNMSHEIRTPMNAIVGFAELLSNSEIGEKERTEFISQINMGTETLLNLVEDIIEISKIEAGQVHINYSNLQIIPFLTEIQLTYTKNLKRYNKENLVISIDNDDFDQDLNIICDPFRLKQIFNNLISNAIKFTENGEIKFGIKNIEENLISFYVMDTGIGIHPDKQLLIFERFRQGYESKTKIYGGTGLGLAISKNLVELMGGEISVNSESGIGSEFVFSIAKPKSRKHPVNSENLNINAVSDWESKTILFAPDETSDYLVFSDALKVTKVNLLLAKDCIDLLNLFKLHPEIDLVLIDVQFLTVNGVETAKELKKIRREIPVIAQSSFTIDGEREKCLNAGCDDYLTKPINHRNLFLFLSRFLDTEA